MIISQALCHPVEVVRYFLKFQSLQAESFLIIMVGNFLDTIWIPPIIEIHSKARFNPGSAAGLVGSVAVSICKLTIDNDTSNTIIATNIPIFRVSFVFIFIMFSSFFCKNKIYFILISETGSKDKFLNTLSSAYSSLQYP